MGERLLFTPGPLTTSPAVRAAMGADWGSRDRQFIEMTARVAGTLLELANGAGTHAAVLLQGAGTFAVEAALDSLIAPEERVLVLINGEYGRRIERIGRRLGKDIEALEHDEREPVDPERLRERLARDPGIGTVFTVHLETTSGILNPLERIAEVVRAAGRRLFVDAMSSFGAYDIDVQALGCAALVASSNKCLHGAPGIGYVIAERALLQAREGVGSSTSLDLLAQLRGFEQNGQWRFTPPTHCLAALDEALREHARGGGCAGRRERYAAIAEIVTRGMAGLGIRPTLAPEHRSDVILTFDVPAEHPRFDFAALYEALASEDLYIYPGKLTRHDTFRIGCIGEITPDDARRLVAAIERALGS